MVVAQFNRRLQALDQRAIDLVLIARFVPRCSGAESKLYNRSLARAPLLRR